MNHYNQVGLYRNYIESYIVQETYLQIGMNHSLCYHFWHDGVNSEVFTAILT
jgi:hypothetical protein